MNCSPSFLWVSFNRRRYLNRTVALIIAASYAVTGCGIIKKKPESDPDTFATMSKPLPPEKAKAALNEMGGNFVYGPNLGETAVNIGTTVLFPPYALYLLSNAVLSLSGYEPVTVAGLLPEQEGENWSETYDGVVGVPGRLVAAVAGREYRSREVAKARMNEIIKSDSAETQPHGQLSQTVKTFR